MILKSRCYVVLAGHCRKSLMPAPCDTYLINKLWILQGFWIACGVGISVWMDFGFGKKFKSQMGLTRYVITQYAQVENGGRALRVVNKTQLEAVTHKKTNARNPLKFSQAETPEGST